MGMGKKILLGFVILIVGVGIFLLMPEAQEAPIELDEDNSKIYYALAQAGIKDAVVDIQEDKVIVDYILPEGMDKDEALFFVLGAVVGVVNNKDISLTSFLNEDTPIKEINVAISDVMSFANGNMTEEELLGKLA